MLPESLGGHRSGALKKRYLPVGSAEYENYFRILCGESAETPPEFGPVFQERFYRLMRRYPFKAILEMREQDCHIAIFVLTDQNFNQEQIIAHKAELESLLETLGIEKKKSLEYIISRGDDAPF